MFVKYTRPSLSFVMEEEQQQDLVCMICLGLFDDPCFCSDGWTYCRLCVAQWAATGNNPCSWKSPHTNEKVPKPAILRSNEAAATAVLRRKQMDLAKAFESRFECPEEFLKLLSCSCEKGRPLLYSLSNHSEMYQALRSLRERQEISSLHFAQALGLVRKLPFPETGMRTLLEITGPGVVSKLVKNDQEALQTPLLRLEVLKSLMGALLEIYGHSSNPGWRHTALELLRHFSKRKRMIDAVDVPEACFSRRQRKMPGSYLRCDHQWGCPPGMVRFACLATGAHLDLELYPPGAFGLLENDRARTSAIITTGDGLPPVLFTTRVKLDTDGVWELRRDANLPVFPDYDPSWEDQGSSGWGEEGLGQLGLFEELPGWLPRGFLYRPRVEEHELDFQDELDWYRSTLQVVNQILDNREEQEPLRCKRSRRH